MATNIGNEELLMQCLRNLHPNLFAACDELMPNCTCGVVREVFIGIMDVSSLRVCVCVRVHFLKLIIAFR